MTDPLLCDDKDLLVSYLYDEIDPILRRRVEEHLRICAACSAELAALSEVRVDLASWTPPEAELDFTIVRRPAAVATPAARWASVPAWAQAAAAVLVLAAGAAIANVQVHSGPDGVTVSTGWMSPSGAARAAAPSTANVSAQASENWKPALAALETQLRSEIRSSRDGASATAVRAVGRGELDEATVTRVRALIEESEARQRRELALRLTQFNRDVNVQRQADLVKIDQLFGQMDGRTGAEMARQRQMLNYLTRVSNPQQ